MPTPFDPKAFLATVPSKPGVYCMYDIDDEVLYVGKAKHLKKRLASYFRGPAQLSPKNRVMVSKIARVEITTTHTETEALLLENNLIKRYQPPYNILLRDDKSYPYIYLSAGSFPRLSYHRGAKSGKGRYFGPYPSGRSVHESLNLLQKLFPVRQCRDAFFRNRSRPCLQYQIKRCSGPCVDLISQEAYADEVQNAVLFLEGKSQAVIEKLVDKMQAASEALAFEKAARYRDQIADLRRLQERQYVDTQGQQDVDVIACAIKDSLACVQVLTIRAGRHLGSRAYFPRQTRDSEESAVLSAFLPQFYLGRNRDLPDEIVLSHTPEDQALISEALRSEHGRGVKISAKVRGARARWVAMAMDNARVNLAQRRPDQYRDRLSALALVLELEELPARMECFDISHTLGESTVASCVVFDLDGPRNSDYRRFNIKDIQAGDDYAAMKQALTRRYQRVREEGGPMPDILFIDGGKGQVRQANEVLEELQLQDEILVIGVAKGTTRKAGFEHLILPDERPPLLLPSDSPALHLIQHIRDESHRFAITTHRKQRARTRNTSSLEDIEGIGAKRRSALISHFGGLQGVQRAGVEDLAKVPGISRQLAQKIYDALH